MSADDFDAILQLLDSLSQVPSPIPSPHSIPTIQGSPLPSNPAPSAEFDLVEPWATTITIPRFYPPDGTEGTRISAEVKVVSPPDRTFQFMFAANGIPFKHYKPCEITGTSNKNMCSTCPRHPGGPDDDKPVRISIIVSEHGCSVGEIQLSTFQYHRFCETPTKKKRRCRSDRDDSYSPSPSPSPRVKRRRRSMSSPGSSTIKRKASPFKGVSSPGKGRTLTHPLVVDIQGDLNQYGNVEDWTPEEKQVGRRLVQLGISRAGRHLTLSSKIVTAEDYDPDTFVVSCIFDPYYSDQCVFTSVDLVSIFEFLVGTKFPTDEKNRIRRNVECFEPNTITKDNHELFFTTIMQFPDPQPRNIEKDIKIFLWSHLPDIIKKVSAKYELPPSMQTAAREASLAVPELIQTSLSRPCTPFSNRRMPVVPSQAPFPAMEGQVPPWTSPLAFRSSSQPIPPPIAITVTEHNFGPLLDEYFSLPNTLTESAFSPMTDEQLDLPELIFQYQNGAGSAMTTAATSPEYQLIGTPTDELSDAEVSRISRLAFSGLALDPLLAQPATPCLEGLFT